MPSSRPCGGIDIWGWGPKCRCSTPLWCRTCVWCRDLERDAISAAAVGIGIQQLLEGDHGCAGFRLAQFVAHLENLPGQAVGLLACTSTVVLVGARGSNVRGQVSPHCVHYAADGLYFWPRQSYKSTICKDLKVAGIPHQGGEWYVQARDKSLWRQLVQGMPSTQVTPTPTRIQPARACKCSGGLLSVVWLECLVGTI